MLGVSTGGSGMLVDGGTYVTYATVDANIAPR